MRCTKLFLVVSLFMAASQLRANNPSFEHITSQMYSSQHDFHSLGNSEFSPLLEAHKNTGAFRTNLHISYPPNSLRLDKLNWRYDSKDPRDRGFGRGWRLDLPRVEMFQGHNTFNSKVELRGFGPYVRGEYVPTSENISRLKAHIEMLTSHLSVEKFSTARLSTYRPLIDRSFQLLLHDRESGHTLILHTNGKGFVFNQFGQLIHIANQLGQTLDFKWKHDLLKKISYKYWQMSFHYESNKVEGAFFSHVGSDVSIERKHLDFVDVSDLSSQASKQYHFNIEGGLLKQVHIADRSGREEVFEGRYSRVIPNHEKHGLADNLLEDGVPFFAESLEDIEWFDLKSVGEYIRYVDLTGNNLSDKIVFDTSRYFDQVLEVMPEFPDNYSFVIDQWVPEKSIDYYQDKIDQINLRTQVFLNQKDANGKRKFEKQNSLEIFTMPFQLVLKEKTKRSQGVDIVTYEIEVQNNLFHFVDLNNDGLKDFVYCDSVRSGEDKLNSVLAFAAKSQGVSISGSYAEKQKNKMRVAYLSKESEVRWIESTYDISCNQDTLFADITGNGLVEVINQDQVYFRENTKKGYISHNVDTSKLFDFSQINELNEENVLLFSAADSQFKVLEGKRSFAKRTTPFVYVYDENWKPYFLGQNHQVLSEIKSPFGGKVEIQYDYKSQNRVVKQKVFVPAKRDSKAPREVTTYEYRGQLYDPTDGMFHGFLNVLKSHEIQSEYFDTQYSEFFFGKDTNSSNSHIYLQRTPLTGKAIRTVKYNGLPDNSTEKVVHNSAWKLKNLSGDRFYVANPLNEKLYIKDKRILSSKKIARDFTLNSTSDWVQRVETRTIVSGIDSAHGNSLGQSAIHELQLYRFDRERWLYLRDVQTKSETGSPRDEEIIRYLYNQDGLLSQIQKSRRSNSRERKRTYFYYDQRGRLIEMIDHHGAPTEVSYGRDGLIFELRNARGIFLLEQDPLLGKLLSYQTPTGVEYKSRYSPLGRLKSVDLLRSNSTTNIFFEEEYRANEGVARYTILGEEIVRYLDSWGRVSSEKRDGMFQGGNSFSYSGQGFFHKNAIGKKTETFYDPLARAKGEIRSFSDGMTFEETISHHFTTQGVQKNVSLNSFEYYSSTLNPLDQVVNQTMMGQEASFRYDGFGNLTRLTNMDTSWEYGLLGEVLSFQHNYEGVDLNQSRDLLNLGREIYMQDGEVRLFDRNENLTERSTQDRFARSVHRNDFLYENHKYDQTLLTESKFQLQEIIFNESYDYDDLDRLVAIKSPLLSKSIAYDAFGNIVETNIGDLQINYVYRPDGKPKQVNGLIENIRYDQLNRVETIVYSGGAKASMGYQNNTLNSVTIKNADGKTIFLNSVSLNSEGKVFRYHQDSDLLLEVAREYSYDENLKLVSDSTSRVSGRDRAGNLRRLQGDRLSYNYGNLSNLNNSFNFYYHSDGHIKFATKNSDLHFYRLDRDTYVVDGRTVHALRVQGKIVGVFVENDFYPALSDYRGSLVALFDIHGEILFHRDYGTWGEKEVYARDEQARKLEELIPWSFAHLIEVPGLDSNATYYWSESRVYSPQAREWLNIDPLFAWNPQELMKHPGNWEPTVYASHDPVNFVDPSGYWGVKFEWVSSVDAVIGVQKSRGIAIIFDFDKRLLQIGSYKVASELKVVAGAGISTGGLISFTNARNLNDIAGRSTSFNYNAGLKIVGDFAMGYSRGEDGYKVFDIGFGGSIGAALRGSTGMYNTDILNVWYGNEVE